MSGCSTERADVVRWRRGDNARRKASAGAPRDARRKKSIMASIYTPTSQHGGLRDVTKICETRINYRRPTTATFRWLSLIRDTDAAVRRHCQVLCNAAAHAQKLFLETLDDKGAECSAGAPLTWQNKRVTPDSRVSHDQDFRRRCNAGKAL